MDKKVSLGRLTLIIGLAIVFELSIIARLINLQFFRRSGFQIRVKEQSEVKVKVTAKRGRIYDRYRRILATSISKQSTGFCERVYPLEEVAGNLLGFVGKDNIGLEGVEYEFDPLLSGKPGWMTLGKTPRGHLYPYPGYPRTRVKPAKDIVLTIDADIQAIIEAALMKRINEVQAKKGSAVVIDPRTGEILAMATVPSYNPNHWKREACRRNVPLQDQFEPGSTFKIVPLSIIVEENLVGLEDTVEDGTAKITISGKTIRDVRPHGPFTFAQAVWKSSNVAFVKLTNLIGRHRFYSAARAFGFGIPTGVSLPGEASGSLSLPSGWSNLRFANLAFGQGVSCSLLQLAFAYQAIANDGVLLKPIIIKEVLSEKGKVLYEEKPMKVREVLPSEKAKEVTELLCGVVENGSGMLARIKGLKMAGKTGTANKCVNGRYVSSYMSSFVCFFPADNPIFLVATVIDEPKYVYLGGEVGGPLMHEIARKIIKIREYKTEIEKDVEQIIKKDEA
ncbi:penicillin-binding protein 2 [candidate division WOR-3 bacterium]|nr:penicillin-binding protein 2 [candidate division WOR-3 bacterium]